MKQLSATILILILSFLSLPGCTGQPDTAKYLERVLQNMEGIKSIKYIQHSEVWSPYEIEPRNYRKLFREYANPADTIIGSAYVQLDIEDGALESGYNGDMRVVVYEDQGFTGVDDFSNNPSPFRMVGSFFNKAKSIIEYTLSTSDSIRVEFVDAGEDYHLKLTIYEDRQVEFFGKAFHINNPYSEDPTSVYEVWFAKTNDLPRKVLRKMSHQTVIDTIEESEFNTLALEDFNIFDYFHPDYEIREYGSGRKKADPKRSLVGTLAPAWTLNDPTGEPVSLADFKSKVLLLNLTGIGCGPCHAALPFLKSLKDAFTGEELAVVAIECWGKNASTVGNYSTMNGLNYPFLVGSDEVIDKYIKSRGVPLYLVLDEERVIRNVFTGYSKESTDNEIKFAINDLL